MPYRNKKTGEIISDEEFAQKFGNKNTTPQKDQSAINAEIQASVQKGKEAEAFLKLPWYKQLFTKQVKAEVPKAIAETLIKTPAKFIASTAEIPETIATGKASQREYNLPLVGRFKSYQSEAETRAGEIVGGQKPLISALSPFAEVPLAGLETFGWIKGIQSGTKAYQEIKSLSGTIKTLLPKKMSPTLLEERLKSGGATYKGIITKTPKAIPTNREIEVAQTVKNIIKPNQIPDKNIGLLKNEIKNIATKQVAPNLEANPQIFNKATLKSRLEDVKLPITFKSNATVQNAYNDVIDGVMKIVDENPKNMAGLWKVRKRMDDIADEARQLSIDARTPAQKAVRDVRNAINQFIIDSIPDGKTLYGQPMRQMSNMYEAIDMLAEYAPKQIVKHPITRGTLKFFGKTGKIVGYGMVGGAASLGIYKATGGK